MIIDLHNHCDLSKNTNLSLDDYINRAIKIGVSFAITEHNRLNHSNEEIQGIKVFSGIEILNNFGDFLVFGAPEDCINIRQDIFKLINYIHMNNGIIIAAHPYSGYGICNVVEMKMADKIIKELDAIEAFNGLANKNAWVKAELLAQKYKKPCTGGSDAHKEEHLFTAGTKFTKKINNLNDLIKEIKAGKCTPVEICKNSDL